MPFTPRLQQISTDAVLFSNDAFGQHYCDEHLFNDEVDQTELSAEKLMLRPTIPSITAVRDKFMLIPYFNPVRYCPADR